MKSLLKVPKYKVCKVKMQRQLDEIKDVFTMSMDLSIDSDGDGGESLEFSDHEDDGEHGDDGSAEIEQDDKEKEEMIEAEEEKVELQQMPLPQEYKQEPSKEEESDSRQKESHSSHHSRGSNSGSRRQCSSDQTKPRRSSSLQIGHRISNMTWLEGPHECVSRLLY